MRCMSTLVLPEPATPATCSTGTSPWRTTAFCSRWMVAVMARMWAERPRASEAKSSLSSMATSESK